MNESNGLAALEVSADNGSLPSPTAVFRGSVGYVHGPIRAEGRAGWWWPRDAALTAFTSPGAGGRFSLFAADVRLCVNVLERSRFAFYPCAGVEVDRWLGEGNEALTKQASTALWGASVAGAALLTWELGPLIVVRGSLETAVPLNPPAFGFLENGSPLEVFRPNLAIRLGGGLELRFR